MGIFPRLLSSMNPTQPSSTSPSASRFRLPGLVSHSLLALLFATAASAASLVISTQTLPASIGGTPYSQTLAAATGVISGTPSTASSWVYSYPFSFYLKVTDSKNASAYVSLSLVENAPSSGGSSGGSSDGSSGGSSGGGTTTSTP